MSKKKILIVDDDPDFAAIQSEILRKAGYDVAHRAHSGEALAALLAGEETPDLIVSDLMMERDDSGFRFCHALRKDPRTAKIPVLMLTAVSRARGLPFDLKSPAAREWIKADDFAEKPIRKETLLAKVRHLLGEPAAGVPADGVPADGAPAHGGEGHHG